MAADVSVDHPLVLENYRTAHEIALRQTRGQANTEELRQAMVHYRTLFEELVNEPEMPLTRLQHDDGALPSRLRGPETGLVLAIL